MSVLLVLLVIVMVMQGWVMFFEWVQQHYSCSMMPFYDV